jgi:uncharacterized membrane protein
MLHYIYAFLASFSIMTVIDSVWLGTVANQFYKKHLGFLLADKPNFLAAGAFYLIFIIGVTIFVVYPGWKNADSLIKIGAMGALFGLVTYATYDLTNQATLKNWPAIITAVDLLWGTVLVATVSVLAVVLLKTFVK